MKNNKKRLTKLLTLIVAPITTIGIAVPITAFTITKNNLQAAPITKVNLSSVWNNTPDTAVSLGTKTHEPTLETFLGWCYDNDNDFMKDDRTGSYTWTTPVVSGSIWTTTLTATAVSNYYVANSSQKFSYEIPDQGEMISTYFATTVKRTLNGKGDSYFISATNNSDNYFSSDAVTTEKIREVIHSHSQTGELHAGLNVNQLQCTDLAWSALDDCYVAKLSPKSNSTFFKNDASNFVYVSVVRSRTRFTYNTSLGNFPMTPADNLVQQALYEDDTDAGFKTTYDAGNITITNNTGQTKANYVCKGNETYTTQTVVEQQTATYTNVGVDVTYTIGANVKELKEIIKTRVGYSFTTPGDVNNNYLKPYATGNLDGLQYEPTVADVKRALNLGGNNNTPIPSPGIQWQDLQISSLVKGPGGSSAPVTSGYFVITLVGSSPNYKITPENIPTGFTGAGTATTGFIVTCQWVVA